MPDSADTLRVQRDSWEQGHIALICGIANAGGGVLLVDSAGKDYAKGLTRMRKPFEQIPRITQKELGIVCMTEPVLDGAVFCLEVVVPAGNPDRPIKYRGACWYYDAAVEENMVVRPEDVAELRRAASEQEQTAEVQPLGEKPPALSHPRKTPAPYSTGLQRGTSCVALPFRNAPSPRRITSTSPRQTNSCSAHCAPTDAPPAPRIAELLGVSESTVRRSFRKLRELGIIDRVGSAKAGYWRLLR